MSYDELLDYLKKVYHQEITYTDAFDKILSLMGENELVVLDAQAPSDGVYSEVRNLECVADEPTVLEHTSGATLETRIEDENPKQKLVNLQTYENDKKRKHIIKQVIDTTKSF